METRKIMLRWENRAAAAQRNENDSHLRVLGLDDLAKILGTKKNPLRLSL